MDYRFVLLIETLLVVTILGLEVDHWGTEFVFSFLKCGRHGTHSSNMIVVTARENTDVYVLFAEKTWTFSLTEEKFKELDLGFTATAEPYSLILPNKSVLIQASKPVSVYGYSNRTKYSDGFLALPVVGLGYQYLVVNIDGGEREDSNFGCQIVIAAPWDGTKVSIELLKANNCSNSTGDLLLYTNGSHVNIEMNSLDVFNFYCVEDTTGALIESSNPIAVLTGSARVPIPSYADEDHVVEMLPPIVSLGNEFVIKAPNESAGDSMVRLVGTKKTEVSTNDSSHIVASRNYLDLVLDRGENLCIKSTQPILVVMFLLGINSTNTYIGDPFMMVIPPVSKFTNDYVIHANALWDFQNYMYVISLSTNIKKILGLYSTVTFSDMSGCPKYSSGVMEWKWVERFNNTEFLILMYGVKRTEGYGFPGGMKLVPFYDRDMCENHHCMNGGWCLSDLKTYKCHCPSEYTGEHCETQISITTTTEVATSTLTTPQTTKNHNSLISNENNGDINSDGGINYANTTTDSSLADTTTTAVSDTQPTHKDDHSVQVIDAAQDGTSTTTNGDFKQDGRFDNEFTTISTHDITSETVSSSTETLGTTSTSSKYTKSTKIATGDGLDATTAIGDGDTELYSTTETGNYTSDSNPTMATTEKQRTEKDGLDATTAIGDGEIESYSTTETGDYISDPNPTMATTEIQRTEKDGLDATTVIGDGDTESYSTTETGDYTSDSNPTMPTTEIQRTEKDGLDATTPIGDGETESYSATETGDYIYDPNPTMATTEIQRTEKDSLDATTAIVDGETESYSTTETGDYISDRNPTMTTTEKQRTKDDSDATSENEKTYSTGSYSTTEKQDEISDSSITTTTGVKRITDDGLSTTADQSTPYFNHLNTEPSEETTLSSTGPRGETSTTKLQDKTSSYISTTRSSHSVSTVQLVTTTVSTFELKKNISRICACPCAKHLNNSEISTLLENQKKFLKVEKATLSQTIRKKQSSENVIQSETNLGVTSVLLVTFLISGIIAVDLTRFYAWLRETRCIESKISDSRRMMGSSSNL